MDLLETCLPEIKLAIVRDKELPDEAKEPLYLMMELAYREYVENV